MTAFLSNIKAANEKHPLIMGSFLLTFAGFLSRLIGFFYRMYLSRQFGEEGMGIYHLVSPIMALSFSLTAAGFQTSISKFVAEYTGQHPSGNRSSRYYHPLLLGLSISLPLSIMLMLLLQNYSNFIATTFLEEPRTAPLLRILALSIPLSATHACINGYFYGRKKAAVPAVCQLLEQLARVLSVYILCSIILLQGRTPALSITVMGIVIGEVVSTILCVCILLQGIYTNSLSNTKFLPSVPNTSYGKPITYGMLLSMVLPLIANRITINLLQSIETVSIPAKLRLYGYDHSTALSVYGVLTGMAFPLIFFPNAITGAIAVILLPLISERISLGDRDGVHNLTFRTIRYCFLLGITFLLIFFLFGQQLSILLFHSHLAGLFVRALSFICPFIYLNSTLSAILQGMGKVITLFIINVTALLLRLLFIFTLVPHYGIQGYLWGLLAGQLLQSTCYLLTLNSVNR